MENDVLLLKYGNVGETAIHPLTLAVIIIACVSFFFIKRHKVAVTLLFIGMLTPLGQKVVIFGLNFMVFRILILVAWLRVLLSENRPLRMNAMDKVIILWVVSNVAVFTLLWQTSGAFVNRLGFAYNALGIYFLFRKLIRDFDEVDRVIKSLAVISIIIAAAMINEQVMGINIFSVFGGVPEITPVREGKLRSQAAFEHALLAGSFGATVLPLLVSQWWRKATSRKLVVTAIASATVITVTSASSGPLLAYVAGIFALMMWHFRSYLPRLRWAFAAMLLLLHLVMNAPVWALIGRVEIFGGSSGYHRYIMIDNFIRRFNEWWLMGTKSTDKWGWMMWDICNEYVAAGINGGLLTFALFIGIIVFGFRTVGQSMKAWGKDPDRQIYIWSFGAALFSHAVVFFGISYFDQSIIPWYFLLAAIATISDLSKENMKPDRPA